MIEPTTSEENLFLFLPEGCEGAEAASFYAFQGPPYSHASHYLHEIHLYIELSRNILRLGLIQQEIIQFLIVGADLGSALHCLN